MRVYTIKNKERIGHFITDLVSDLNRWAGDKPLTVTIADKKEKRSLDQNALYWKWIDLIASQVGDNKDSVHHDMRSLFLPFSRSSITQKLVPASTTKLSVKEMAEYMEKIQAWAGQYLNMTLPTADDLIDYSSYER